MKLWDLVGIKRVEPSIRPMFLRCGVAQIMTGAVEASSLGKMTTDWTMTAVYMAEGKHELRKFLERAAAQKPRRAHHGERTYATIFGLISMAQGTLNVLSLGHLDSQWRIAWMCYGEEIIERAEGLFRRESK